MLTTLLAKIPEPIKALLDATSIGTVIGTMLNMIPHMTAIVGLVWMCVRLYQEPTVQKILNKGK
jgi:chromate transport protein ChrA